MEDAQLRETLQRLRAEIEQLGPEDAAVQARLNLLVADVERRLEGADDDGLIDNIKESVEQFEVKHPRATAILNDVMLALSNMGI
ncbi:MAG: DUF4404 family protein [Hyphomonadaceae bacterium]|nr:DUF4404 family protein [Hyphomonadaceae bacterium]